MEDNEFEDILLISWTDVRSETQDYTIPQFEAIKEKYRVDFAAIADSELSRATDSMPKLSMTGRNYPVLKYLSQEGSSQTANMPTPPIKFISRCIPSARLQQKFIFAKNRSVYLVSKGEAILNGSINESVWELKKLDDVSIPNDIQYVAQTRRSIWVFCDHYPPRCYRDLKFHTTALFPFSGFNSKGAVTLGSKIFYRNNYGEVSMIDESQEVVKTSVFIAPDNRSGPVLDFAVDGSNQGTVFWIGTKNMQIYRRKLLASSSELLRSSDWNKQLEKSWPSHAIVEILPEPTQHRGKNSNLLAQTQTQTTILCVRTRLTEPGLDISLLSLKPPTTTPPNISSETAGSALFVVSHLALPTPSPHIVYKARLSAPRRGVTHIFLPFGRRLAVVGAFGRSLWHLQTLDIGCVVSGCAFLERAGGWLLLAGDSGVSGIRVRLD